MPTFLHRCEYSGRYYDDKQIFEPGDEVPEHLLKNSIVMFHTDSPIDVPPKSGTPEDARAQLDKRMQKAEDAAHLRRQDEERRTADQAAVNEQKARALAEAAGLGNYAPGPLPAAQAPAAPAPAARTAPMPLRQPLRQSLGPRRASN